MSSFFSPVALLIPIVIYVIILGIIFWLVMRLIRSNEKIAFHSERIANALTDRNEIEREKMKQ